MFFQLKSFDPSASDSTISTQAGIIIGAKTAAMCCTGMLWGRAADSEWGGRKLVLLIGLLSSGIVQMNDCTEQARLILSIRHRGHWIWIFHDFCLCSSMAGLWWNDEQQCRYHKMRCRRAESGEEVSAYLCNPNREGYELRPLQIPDAGAPTPTTMC